ncbi:MAG: hypothetical protein JF631_10340, partial [Mycobacterium sp.]|nr:hypothetical protein [Mycobacterium sp.]
VPVFGNVIADLTEPVLTQIVNSAYPSGNPIPADPSKYQPATPFSSLTQLAATATAGSSSKTTSTTAITATDPEPTVKKKSTTAEESKPLTNVVRDSAKAVPHSVGGGESTLKMTSDPVATVGKSTKDEQETTQEEPAQSGTTSGEQSASAGTDAEAGTS